MNIECQNLRSQKKPEKEDYLIYNYDDKSLKDLKTKANKIPFSLKNVKTEFF